MMIRPFWCSRYIHLEAPQWPTGPRVGIPVEPQTVAPAGIPLQGAVLLRRLVLLPPCIAGRQCRERRERGVGQQLFEVRKGEKEYGPLTLGSPGARGRQQGSEGQEGKEREPESRAQGLA